MTTAPPPQKPKRRLWLWILVAVFVTGFVCVMAVAGMGFYFVSRHYKAERTSSSAAFRMFDEARARFKDAKPLYELDRHETPKLTRRLEDLPTSTQRPESMYVMAWDPDKERVARISLPFWILKLGKRKIDLTNGLNFERMNIDVQQLERVGPILLFDYRPQTGQRVLVWTQ